MAQTVAVIGAGPAGIVAAIALKRKGFNVALYDKTELAVEEPGKLPTLNFGEIGGGVSLYGNGLRALRNLGLLEAVEELRTDVEVTEMNFMLMDGSDRIVRNLSTTKEGEIPPLHVLRAPLHEILLKSAIALGIKCFCGRKIKSLVESESNITVHFANGTSTTADFVVAADGIHSTIRRLLWENAPKPSLWGTGYIGVLERGESTFDYGMGLYIDPIQGKTVFFTTCGKYETAFSVSSFGETTPVDTLEEDWRPVTDLPKESTQLADLVDSWGIPKSASACIRRAKRLNPVSVYDLPDLSTFHKGRVVLVGDAAHGTLPTYGQGLNQALEDAAALGDLFGHFEGPEVHVKVFEVYDEVRLARVHKCAAIARDTAARMKAPSAVGMRIGRFIMRVIFTITNWVGGNDAVMYHDYRDDIVKVVPGITFQ
ncbi:hypothetical protein HDU98_008368 [Podochytrium sp. JEL0797]|nr:hypothetical protein HDU98_008368 [Podochytrium sp. JEL0797]